MAARVYRQGAGRQHLAVMTLASKAESVASDAAVSEVAAAMLAGQQADYDMRMAYAATPGAGFAVPCDDPTWHPPAVPFSAPRGMGYTIPGGPSRQYDATQVQLPEVHPRPQPQGAPITADPWRGSYADHPTRPYQPEVGPFPESVIFISDQQAQPAFRNSLLNRLLGRLR